MPITQKCRHANASGCVVDHISSAHQRLPQLMLKMKNQTVDKESARHHSTLFIVTNSNHDRVDKCGACWYQERYY